ncbi:pickpocket protein 28-like [Toxorhynchites rutilus septentrionalis]|uniref:pickpocket protein 28-like n=1 Tax=Toxorhynchites rutilus septentrionalis TaxID=329112 RepID=UPI00247AA634|nr:pickpocket protein 28-like [Toxorhynchites rutilus septentrionalis]
MLDAMYHNSDSRSVSNFELKAINAIDNRRICRGLKSLFLEYCSNSSIHGVRYFGCRRRTPCEKIWWMVTFFLSLYGCGRLIHNVYVKWDQTPVIVSFNEKSTPVWQIPFPAITVCPETKTKFKYLDFTEAFHMVYSNDSSGLDGERLSRLQAVAQVCDAHIFDSSVFNQTYDSECVNWLKNVSVSDAEMLMICRWRNDVRGCDDIFSTTITEEGLCYTFNAVASDELLRQEELHGDYPYMTANTSSPQWTLENGYTEHADIDTYPVRVLGAGARAGLNLLLRLYEYDLDYLCRGPVQGFKVLLHPSSEYPQVSKQYFRVPLNQEVIISVKPQMITTSDGLRDYAPHRRQCYFNHERRLKYFKVYTQQNCELECRANYTLQTCGCVKFSMPRDANTEVCGATKIQCYNEAEDALLGQDVMYNVDKRYDFGAKCDCLPACTSVQYDAEISQADFNWKDLFLAYKSPLDEFPGVQLARLTVYFKESQFITSKRSELYGITDFLANCGGLLGLFMGVSLLSLAEIVYFCSIRPFTILRAYRSKHAPATPAAFAPPVFDIEKPKGS